MFEITNLCKTLDQLASPGHMHPIIATLDRETITPYNTENGED